MDLSLSPEDRAFREEVRDFFRTSVPAAVRQGCSKPPYLQSKQSGSMWQSPVSAQQQSQL